MPNRLVNRGLGRVAEKVPGLRRIPVVKLLAMADVALLAREHLARLEPDERRRLVALVRSGRGRADRLTEAEARELHAIVAKLEPRRLVGQTVDAFSPVPLPRRILYGKR